jgi:hypothetical protein
MEHRLVGGSPRLRPSHPRANLAVMPSFAHDVVADLFKTRPALAAEMLVEVLGISLPAYTEARPASC